MRHAALLAGLLFLGVSLSWLARDPELARRAYGAGSSLSTAPEGLSLARAYLAEREGAAVSSLARPVSRAQLPEGGVLIRAEPKWFAPGARPRQRVSFEHHLQGGGVLDGGSSDAGASDAGAAALQPARSVGLLSAEEEAWVARGGRLLLAVTADYGPLEVSPSADAPKKVFPALPGVQALLASKGARGLAGAGLVDAITIFAVGDAALLARRAIGAGDVWLLAAPDILSNQALGSGDHLRLLVALAGGGRPVLFDEYVHGLTDDLGPFELLRRWGLGPACFLFALAGVGWFWRRAVTVGAPAPFRDLRTESVDLAYAVGELYQRAIKPRDQLALQHARLLHELHVRLGLPAAAAQQKAAELLLDWHLPAEGQKLSPAAFQHHLEALNNAFRRLRDGHRQRR